MFKRSLLVCGSLALLAASWPGLQSLTAQAQETTRKLWYPTSTTSKAPAKRRYRVVTPALPATQLIEDTLLGVTIYRLRPPRVNEPGARLLKHTPSGDAEWLPVRVASDTPLRENSLVRLSIEAARTGYLYVVDREMYANGTLGQPQLIFPTKRIRNGQNQVQAKSLIELPDRADEPLYFTLKRSQPNHVGELLTVLITPQPLSDVAIGADAVALPESLVKSWEQQWRALPGRLEMVSGAGQRWTEDEKAAGGNPQLTLKAAAPGPQTVYYNPAAQAGEPLLANVRLRLAR